ncbi:hypothetical protein PWP93_05345 [Paraburkholderia sp. A1RI-2L]
MKRLDGTRGARAVKGLQPLAATRASAFPRYRNVGPVLNAAI